MAEKLLPSYEILLKQSAELNKNEAYGVSAITYNMHLAEENLCMFLLSFIESLEKSLPVEESEIDLKKEVKRWKNKHGVVGMDDLWFNFAHRFYDLGCRHAAAMYDDIEFERQRRSEEEPTIKGWVARDDYIFRHGCLYLYITKPRSDGNYGWCGKAVKELDTHLFPDLKWIDGPIEVELQIKQL